MASVRRSLFTSEAERFKFLNRLVSGTREILRTEKVTGGAKIQNPERLVRIGPGPKEAHEDRSSLVGTDPESGRVLRLGQDPGILITS